MKSNISNEEFYVLHEEVVHKIGSLGHTLNNKFDYAFYGYDKGIKEPNSIANIVHNWLLENGYSFESYSRDGKDQPVNNLGEVLRKAKNKYNRGKKMDLEEAYLKALLFFLGKSQAEIATMISNYNIKELIDCSQTTKPKPNHLNKTQIIMSHPSQTSFPIVESHFRSKFCLYSYNETRNRIYKAVIDIVPQGNGFNVSLNNPIEAYPYEGEIDYHLVSHGVVLINLKTPLDNKGLYIMLNVDLNLPTIPEIYIGQMSRYGLNTKIFTSHIFMERIESEQVETPRTYDLAKGPDGIPPHVYAFFARPVYLKTPKKQFNSRGDFEEWCAPEQSEVAV